MTQKTCVVVVGLRKTLAIVTYDNKTYFVYNKRMRFQWPGRQLDP